MPTVAASSSGRGTSVSSLTVSHTVPAGTNRLLVVFVDCSSGMTLTATYGGTPLQMSSEAPGGFHLGVFTVANPTVGTANVVLTSGGPTGTIAACVMTLTDCVGLGPLTAVSGTSTAPSVTVTSATGDLVLDLCVAAVNAVNFTVGAGQTSILEQDGLSGASGRIAVSSEPGAASVTMTWTLSVSTAWILGALTAYATAPAGPLAVVQTSPEATATSAAAVAVTFSSPPAIGNAIVVAVCSRPYTLPVTTVTDTAGHTYVLAKEQPYTTPNVVTAIWLCAVTTATASPFTITATSGAGSAHRLAVALEISGVGVGLLVDQTAGANANLAPLTVGPLPPLSADDVLVLAAFTNSVSTASITIQTAPPWVAIAERLTINPVTGEVDYRVLTRATGASQSVTWTSATVGGAAMALVAFKAGAPVLITVPDVVGETEAAADTILIAAGLVTGTVTTAASDAVPAGQVISQSPTAGASVTIGTAVDLVVSIGPAGPPVYVIGIGEIEVVPLLATFRIQETIDAPDTMIADVFSVATPPALPAYQARILADGATAYWPLDDPIGSTTARDLVGADDPVPFVRFSLGQPVVVTENGVRIFGGVVTGTREQGLTGPSATDLVVEIQATSYELSAARRVITAAISQDGAETIGAAFATLVTDYYAEVDVTLHPSQVAGPALPAATFTRQRGDAVNKHLAASVGYLQSIDFENRLRAWAPGDVLAPANYDEAVNPELLTGDITVERQLQNGYANRVILVGDPIPVPGHVDHFTGDGVTNVWPVTYVVNGPYPYFVDGAVAQGVIQYPATSTTESIGGVESPPGFLWEYDPIAHTIHRRAGPVAAGVAFDFPYDGLFIPAGMAEDAGEIADLGLWEHVENVTAVITDVSAQGYADALLAAKIASKDEIVRLQTRALGFHPGQTMTIASFSRLLAGDYLITQVDTGSESGGILLVRSITASKSQNNTHDWRRVYQQWAGASAAQNP